jgi:hypothetical protein
MAVNEVIFSASLVQPEQPSQAPHFKLRRYVPGLSYQFRTAAQADFTACSADAALSFHSFPVRQTPFVCSNYRMQKFWLSDSTKSRNGEA